MSSAYEHRFKDPAIRLVRESDIPDVIELFKLNYGDDYPYPEIFDGSWVKTCIYSDEIVCVVLEEEQTLVACGAMVLTVGDYNDQIGELGRLVAHPDRAGRGLGSRIAGALIEAAEEHVEFMYMEGRTVHRATQRICEKTGFSTVGFVPLHLYVEKIREGFILYGKLLPNGLSMRSRQLPMLIPEIVPLAKHVLTSMQLPTTVQVAERCDSYPHDVPVTLEPMSRLNLARLKQVKHGRIIEPLLFGPLSVDQGHSFIKGHKANYLIAVDEQNQPIGAIGFQEDQRNKNLKCIELIAESEELRGFLCGALVRRANEFEAELVEVNLSAYDARLQRTFYDYGFRPVTYAPAFSFHGTERLDVVKMIKLNIPYQRVDMKLTDKAAEVVRIVEEGFK